MTQKSVNCGTFGVGFGRRVHPPTEHTHPLHSHVRLDVKLAKSALKESLKWSISGLDSVA